MAAPMTEGEATRFANTLYHWLNSPEAVARLRGLQRGLDALFGTAPPDSTVEVLVQHDAGRGLLMMAAHLPPEGQRIETEDCDAFRGFQGGLSLAVFGATRDLLARRPRPIAVPMNAKGQHAALAGPLDAAMESLYEAVKRALVDARAGAEA